MAGDAKKLKRTEERANEERATKAGSKANKGRQGVALAVGSKLDRRTGRRFVWTIWMGCAGGGRMKRSISVKILSMSREKRRKKAYDVLSRTR